MYSASTRKAVSKACDACRKRKVKCNGLQPCAGCQSASLTCTFLAPRGQGGNRGPRATVLNQLRAQNDTVERTQAPVDPDSLKSVRSMTSEFAVIDTCMETYTKHIYPVVPLLDAAVIKTQFHRLESSPSAQRFVQAFCAYVSNFGIPFEGDHGPARISAAASKQRLLDIAMSTNDTARRSNPEPLSVYTSFFLYGAWAGQGDYQQAWYHLREATTVYMMLRPNLVDDWYDENARRHLFWILVVSERSHAVRRNRPITVSTSDASPSLEAIDRPGLRYLASLFRPLDEAFFMVWNGAARDCSKEWLLQLEHDVRTALPPMLDISDEETANIKVSQYWLQIKLWELFPRYGFLSTESVYECLTFRYPLAVAKSLTSTATTLPVSSLQVHGIGMTEKVFDIACAFVDVLPFVPTQSDMDPLIEILSLLLQLPGGSAKFIPLLMAKVNELIPDLPQKLCQAVQIPFVSFSDPMSPDTRFVYDEEVGRGLYMDLRR